MTMFWFDRPIGIDEKTGWEKVGFCLWQVPLRRDGKVLAVISEDPETGLAGLGSMSVREMRKLIEQEKRNEPVAIKKGVRIGRINFFS